MIDKFDDKKLDSIEHAIEVLDTAYLLGEPTFHPNSNKLIDDIEYDSLFGKNGSERLLLRRYRPESAIFKGITAANVDFAKTKKVVHEPPMTSIDKADGTKVKKYKRLGEWMLDCLGRMNVSVSFNRELFKTDDKDVFAQDIKTIEAALASLAEQKDINGTPIFVQSLKHDGCAVSLYYRDSRIFQAGNRPRDGINAASVLDHVKQVVGIPNSLLVNDLDITIRGEVELRISNFESVNVEAKLSGEKTYENPRNATAGAMNPLCDPSVARKRKLSFVGYSVLGYSDAPYRTAIDRAKWANQVLKIPFIRINPFVFSDLAKIENETRGELDYGIDGIIIEVNDLEAAEDMGHQEDNPLGDPRCKLAWKFSAERAKANVIRVRHEMKRSGKLSCVAEFPAVRLAGTNVVNCTLHNARQMIDGGVGAGATILVYKAGEIIPYWEETISRATVNVPKNCPSCISELEWSASNVDLMCKNEQCPARHVDSLVHYIKNVGVKGISDSTVISLVGAGILKTFGDFYRLDPIKLSNAGFSQRESILDYARIHLVDAPEKVKDSIDLLRKAEKASESKKPLMLSKFIAALGIAGAGKGTGVSLETEFGTLDKIRNASVLDLSKAPDIGTKTAEVLYEWFKNNGNLIDDLLQYIEIEKTKVGIFSGKNFCFSGSFQPSKEHFIELVENEGGKTTSAPSKKTNYFVYGPGSGNKKDTAERLKAAGHAIELMEIEEVERMLGIDKQDDRTF